MLYAGVHAMTVFDALLSSQGNFFVDIRKDLDFRTGLDREAASSLV
jgi:hypothetical protein